MTDSVFARDLTLFGPSRHPKSIKTIQMGHPRGLFLEEGNVIKHHQSGPSSCSVGKSCAMFFHFSEFGMGIHVL